MKKPAPFRTGLRLLEQQGYLRDQSRWVAAGRCGDPIEVDSGQDREGLPEAGRSRSKSLAALKVPPEGSASGAWARVRPPTIKIRADTHLKSISTISHDPVRTHSSA